MDRMTSSVAPKLRLSRFQTDVMLNMASLAVTGVTGILINALISRCFGEAALGVFNVVFACYVVVTQVAVLGLHTSVLKAIASHGDDRRTAASILAAALVPTVALALPCSIIFWLAGPLVSDIVKSPDVARGMMWAAPGIFLFAINKVLINAVNGLQWMKWYAVLNLLRAIGLAGTLACLAYYHTAPATLAFILTGAESLVFLASLIPLITRSHLSYSPDIARSWIWPHLSFGVRSAGAGFLVELNSRIDVLMLAPFVSDRIVGVYSLAAILAEGFYQLLAVLRNNYNPILARLLHQGDTETLKKTVRKGKWTAYAMFAIVAVVAIALYPLAVRLMAGPHADIDNGWPVFSIIMIGMALGAGYLPFSGILLQANRPGLHTIMMITVVLFAIASNAIAIPLFGLTGAAVATAITYVFHAWLLRRLTLRATGVNL